MTESRKRGGKKAHNKRIKARKQLLKAAQKKYMQMFESKMKELKEKFSEEDLNVNVNGVEVPFEVVETKEQ